MRQQTVGGLLIDERGLILMGLRASWKAVFPEHWDAIGGHVEPGETIVEALVRELQEEIGVIATDFTHLGEAEASRSGPVDMLTCHVFAVTGWTGEVWNACDEHSELRWFPLDELSALGNLAGFGYPEFARKAVAIRLPEALG